MTLISDLTVRVDELVLFQLFSQAHPELTGEVLITGAAFT